MFFTVFTKQIIKANDNNAVNALISPETILPVKGALLRAKLHLSSPEEDACAGKLLRRICFG